MAENTYGALHVASKRRLLMPFCSTTRSEGNGRRRPRRNTPTNRPEKAMKSEGLPTSDNETSTPSSHDEIIALFKRIQTSISKEGSVVSKRIGRNTSREKKSAKTGGLPESSSELEDRAPEDIKTLRPLSNFVKKSPIPSTQFKEKDKKEVEKQVTEIDRDVKYEMQNLDEMKLNELKELAKVKGIKGYSKLKKLELVGLLKRSFQSSL